MENTRQKKKKEEGSLFFVAAREKSGAAVPATGRKLQADWEKVLLPCTALFVIALCLRHYLAVCMCTRLHVCISACVCVCLQRWGQSQIEKYWKKKCRNIFSLFVCATVSAQAWGVGESEVVSGVRALCVRKAADWKQLVSLEKS